jgi:hypothetical protein
LRRRRSKRISGAKARFEAVTPQEWSHKVLPECRGKAQGAVAQLRTLGIRVELRRGELLAFTLEDTEVETARARCSRFVNGGRHNRRLPGKGLRSRDRGGTSRRQ